METEESRTSIYDLSKEIILQNIAKTFFTGLNQDLAFNSFVNNEEKNTKQSPNRMLTVLGYLLKNAQKEEKNISTIYCLCHIKEKNILEKIDKDSFYYPIFEKFSPEKQHEFIDYLYRRKYNPNESPVWQKIISSVQTKGFIPNIEKWFENDPAAKLYNNALSDSRIYLPKSCRDFEYNETKLANNILSKNDGLGRTELPLLWAIYKHKKPDKCEFVFTKPIKALDDIDIQALKEIEPETLSFSQMHQNACISSTITELNMGVNNPIFCNKLPNDLTDLVHLQENYEPYISWHYSNKYDYYCAFDPYWRIKTIGKVGLFCASFYCAIKYIWTPIAKEIQGYNNSYEVIRNQHIVSTLDTTIKPQITPTIKDALNIKLQLDEGKIIDKVLSYFDMTIATDYLQSLAGPPNDQVVANAQSLIHANTIIKETKMISIFNDYDINPASISTPFNIYNKAGILKSMALNIAYFFPSGYFYSLYALIMQPFGGLAAQKIDYNTGLLSPIANFFILPARLFNQLLAIPISYIKPEWIASYNIEPTLTIMVRKK